MNICSNPKNFTILKFTDGWNLRPPLYGPIAELNCTLNPLFIWISPLSSIQGTLNIICLSGSTKRSNIFSSTYVGFFSNTGTNEVNTSSTVWWNSPCPGFFAFTSSITCSTICFTFFSILISPFALLISLFIIYTLYIFWNINYSILWKFIHIFLFLYQKCIFFWILYVNCFILSSKS